MLSSNGTGILSNVMFPSQKHNKDVTVVKSTDAEVVQLLVFIVPEELKELSHIMRDQS